MGKRRKRLTMAKYAKKYASKRTALFNKGTEAVTTPSPTAVTIEAETVKIREPEVTTECALPEVTIECSMPPPAPVKTEAAPTPNALKEVAKPAQKKRRRRSSRKTKASTKKANS